MNGTVGKVGYCRRTSPDPEVVGLQDNAGSSRLKPPSGGAVV